MLRILFVMTGLLSFSIEAKPLSILCKGTLNWEETYGYYEREDALLEIYIQDSTKRFDNLKSLNNYIIMPKYNRFNKGYRDKHPIEGFKPTSDEYKIVIRRSFTKAEVVIQRKTGRINLSTKLALNHSFDGVCENALENKF